MKNYNLHKAKVLLQKGHVIGIKTDTVYGLASLEKYEYKIYKLKKRSKNKKIVTVINNYIKSDDLKFNSLQYNKWPGPTTIIKDLTSYRYTNNYTINELIKLTGEPLKITSANISGQSTVADSVQFKNTFKNIYLVSEVIKESKSNTPSEILLYNSSINNFKVRVGES